MPSEYNKLIIITAPSGAGKTSITHHLLKNFSDELAFSVSATTRQKRDHEINGVHYYFVTEDEFKEKIRQKEFAEWEMVYEGKYYGTLKSEMKRIWNDGKAPVLDIDVKGAVHVQGQYPEQSISIFIEPPSIDELKKRLLSRGTETPETLAARVNKAAYEISFKDQFDKIIVNDDLKKACNEAEKIIEDFLSS